MKKVIIKGLFAVVLFWSYGCDQSQMNTDRKQPDEQVQAESAAESGYGSDTNKSHEGEDTTMTR
ncbi:hypothetical protein [Adhaeribacter aquaticus]|uniref:hypothetical protein n=1 Tax=Adhaeribacter aquaticus TaxID=299567 RepID=UPI00041DEE49|nr:hypothetical protein [Adhaeribacter aquaticus]